MLEVELLVFTWWLAAVRSTAGGASLIMCHGSCFAESCQTELLTSKILDFCNAQP